MSTGTTAHVSLDLNKITKRNYVLNEENLEKKELKALFKLIDKKESSGFSIEELQHLLKECKSFDVSCLKPEKIVEEIRKIKEYVSDCEDLPASFVLRRASQGILLTGISLADYPEVKNKRHPLVQLSCDARGLQESSLKPFVCDQDFYSERLCEEFERDADILGISAAIDLADSVKTETNDIVWHDFYCCIIWFVVPFISWQPTYENFSFSNQALRVLIDIENLLQKKQINEAKTKCRGFFLQFGSHVNFGDAHLGGVFKVKAVYKGSSLNDQLKKIRVQNILSCKLKDTFCLDYECSTKCATDQINRDKEPNLVNGSEEQLGDTGNEVQILHSQTGGPTEVSCIPLWRRATAAYNRSWAVVDRGKHDLFNYVGVWTLVRNQSTNFNDHASLSKLLSETWLELGNEIFNCFSYIPATDEYFQNRMKSLSFTSTDILHKLKILTDTFQQLERTFGPSYLKDKKYHECEQFIDIMNCIPSFAFSKNNLIELRENVIHLLCLCNEDYTKMPNNQDLHRWLLRTEMAHKGLLKSKHYKSVEEFLNELDGHFMKSVRLVNEYPMLKTQSEHELSRSVDLELSFVFMDLFTILTKNHKYDEFILLLSLVILLDFDTENAHLGTSPNRESLENFLRNAKQRLAIFQKIDIKCRIPWGMKNIITSIMKTKGEKTEHLDKYDKILKFLSKYHITEELEIDIFPNDLKDLDDILITLNEIIPIWWENLPQKLYPAKREESDLMSGARTLTHKPLCDLLKMIGMVTYFPENLSIEKALLLNDNMFSDPKEMKDVPFVIIRRIMCVNYNFRETILEEFLQRAQKTDKNITQSTRKPSIVRSRRNKSNSPNCHPLDVFLAIFMCCDPFLKRVLAKKISICQMSLPIVYNDYMRNGLTFSLWPLRDIYLDGESESVATQALKVVSFIRIGDKPLKSKSKLINKFLRDQNVHDTFFHCDCALGQQKRTISEGLIEISWYIPNTKDCNLSNQDNANDIETINMPLTVFNLRGDASKYEKQLELLLLMSNIVVIFIKFEGMSDDRYLPLLCKIHSSSVNVVILTNLPEDDSQDLTNTPDEDDHNLPNIPDDDNHYLTNIPDDSNNLQAFFNNYSETTKMDDSKTVFISTSENGKDLNESQIRQILSKEIAVLLNSSDDIFVIENIQMVIPSDMQIYIDEDNTKCMKAKEMFDYTGLEKEFREHSTKTAALKDRMLPLQGETFWHEWSKKQKEYNRSSNRKVYHLNDPHRKAMQICRSRQVDTCNGASPVIINFAMALVENINDESLIKYFILWISDFLHKRSQIILPLLRLTYNEAFRRYELSRLKMMDDLASYEQAKRDIERAEKSISKASFGIEHLFREIGQVYEAFLDCNAEMKTTVSPVTMQFLISLPNIVAKLLLMGHSLEIMDGDAANIPQRWIHSIFSELSVLLGIKKKVFIISVVGIQSSGKSTLLNTMFGLQFAVSAGRCTRGLFLQLLPIDRQHCSLQFDYVMIIDSEGLRAPEMLEQRITHDNELATLAIGLADVAIVNIKGEVFADMEDILQIVVHAIVRLKHAKGLTYHQSSVFVHQNISDPDASSKTCNGKFKLVQNLDEKTCIVAAEENMADITSFCDVIEFDSSKHVKYICDLWQGSPPEAPANPRYSSQVMNVVDVILNDIAKERRTFLTISETEMHIRSIWEGILSENFIFSFRNTLEVKAFTSLEAKYKKLSWQLNEFKLEWLTMQIFPELSKCKTEGDIEICNSKWRNAFDNEFDKLSERVCCELDEFFNKSDLRDYMVHWKDSKLNEIKSKAHAIKMETHTNIEIEKNHCIEHLVKRNLFWENKKRIIKQAVDLANDVLVTKQTPSTKEIDDFFEDLWTSLLEKYAPETRETQEIETAIDSVLKNEMKHILRDVFMTHQTLLDEGFSADMDNKIYNTNKKLKNSFTMENIQPNHIKSLTVTNTLKDGLKKGVVNYLSHDSDHRKQALNVINDILTIGEKLLEEVLHSGNAFDRIYFIKLLNEVIKRVDEHNRNSIRHGYTLTPKFKVDISLHVSKYAFKTFQIMNETNRKKKSLRTLLNSEKNEIKTLFVGVCLAKAKEVLGTDLICSGLRHAIKCEIMKLISLQIPKTIIQIFNERKVYLIREIIRDLIKNESFEDVLAYLRHSEIYAYKWLLKFIKKFFSDRNEESPYYKTFIDFLKGEISNIVTHVRECLQCVSKSHPTSNKLWVKHFLEGYEHRSKFSLSLDSFLSLGDLSRDELQEMKTNIEQQLCVIESDMIMSIHELSMEEIKWENNRARYLEIFNFLWDCKELCPLCKEPCIKSSQNHSHECLQHRPSGIIGVAFKNSNKLSCETCEFDIQSTKTRDCGMWCGCPHQSCPKQHPLKQFKNIVPEWNIRPSKHPFDAVYWAWLMTKYKHELAYHHEKVVPDIPQEWLIISKKDALLSLDEHVFIRPLYMCDCDS